MADRSTPRFFEDTFGRDDGTDIGGSWTQSGTLQILNQSLRQSGATATEEAYAVQDVSTAAADCGSAYEVILGVGCASDDATDERQVTALLRFQGTPDTGDGYGVSLSWQAVAGAETLMLKIRKCLAGTWSDLTEVDVTDEARLDTGGSYDGVIQVLRAKIYEVEGDVQIEAALNDRAAPRLTYTDKEYPLFRAAGSFGTFHEDLNAGVDGYIIVTSIVLSSIQQDEDTAGEVAYKWSFGEIKRQVRTHARRDSLDTLDDTYWADIINESLQEFALHHLPAFWWEEKVTINLKAGQSEFVLPPNVILFDDNVYDSTNNKPVPVVRARDFESFGSGVTGVGQVQSFLATGRGSGGGLTMEPRPRPANASTFTIRCWRQPAILVNDDQIPDLPEALIPGLIWGAVYLYSLRSSDRTHIAAARDEKAMWYKSATRLRNRFHGLSAPQYAKGGFRIGTAINRMLGRTGRG